MSVLLLASIAIPGGLAALITAARPRASLAIGGATAFLALVAAAAIDAQDTIPLAGGLVAGSDGVRVIALAWAAGILLVGLAEGLLDGRSSTLGPALVGLGTGVVALAVADAGVAFALLTAGAVAAAVGPLLGLSSASADIALLGLRVTRPVTVAGILALLAVAWGASAVGPFSAIDPLGGVDPALEVGIGLALVGLAAAIVVRMGAIPAHVWAARYAETAPLGALPATLGWGAAAFALVGLAWIDVTIAPAGAPLITERAVVALVAAASVLLGGVAAILHDDLEHVLGYSIVQDAGVALLAFAVIEPEAAAAGRDWLVGMVALKTGLAAWVLVARGTFGVHRLSELRGWARSSPILGLALAIIIVGIVGLPGIATFEARGLLVELALPAPFDLIVLVAAFAPLAYLGRILLLGLDGMSGPVRDATGARPRLRGLRPGGWTSSTVGAAVRAVPVLLRENRLSIAATAALAAAVLGFAVATSGLGTATFEGPGVDPGPGPGSPLPSEPLGL